MSDLSQPALSEEQEYPHLANLLASWFHQDYALDSEDFKVIVLRYKEVSPEGESQRTAGDIDRFIERYGENNDALQAAMERVFAPCIIVEGWDGLNTQGWLLKVAELLRG
jgi:hypothetical protein